MQKYQSEPDELLLKRVSQASSLVMIVLFSTVLLIGEITSASNLLSFLPASERMVHLQDWLIRQVPISILLMTAVLWVWKVLSDRAIRKLARHLQLMRSFVQDAGHELCAPVSILDAHLQVVEREFASLDLKSEHMPAMHKALDRLTELVGDFRFLAKTQTPLRRENLSIMKLDDLVKDLVKSFQPGFAAKNIQIRFENSGNCSFVGDKEGWLRVANNLVGNALRYCEAGNRVLVSVHESSANLKLAVSDDGNGIAKDDLPNVFDRFYRASSTRSRAEGGSGLGLAIVKAVVESQGGEIVVASDIGKGTSFEVLVPRSPVVHPFINFLNKDA